jgi:site-specific recombinase XerD
MRTFNELLPQYLSRKKISLHKKTYTAYVSRTKIFSTWLQDNGLSDTPIEKLTSDNICEFFYYLASEDGRDVDRPTCEKYNHTLKTMFKYYAEAEGIEKLPFDTVEYPVKKRDNAPKYIPKDKQRALFNDIKANDYQLYLACMIQYAAAVRPGKEMLNLKVGDFDFDGGTIRVGEMTAKTGRCRYADFTEELKGYCREYGIEGADSSLYVFGTKKKMGTKHISENMLRYRFNPFREKHGISKEVKLYSMKCTGGTDLINSRLVSLTQLQKHFGHARISSTERYVQQHGGVTNAVIINQFKSPMAQ